MDRQESAPSSAEGEATPRRRFFYGWWIVVAGTLGVSINSGFYYLGIGAFFLPVAETFNASKTALSGAFSLARLESGLVGPIQGYLIDRFGARRVMFVGIGLMGGGFMMLATVQSLVWFYVVFVATIALGASFSFTQPVQAVVINWFIRRRTRVLGIVLTGSAIGGLIVPAVAWGIETHGWRGTAFLSGVSIIALGWPIAAVMRYRPEPYGYLPDNQPRPTKSQNGGPADDEGYFAPGEAMRSSTFWVMGLCFSMRMLGTAAVPVHLVAYLSEDVGFSTTRAALFLGLIGPASAGGRLGMGFLGDMFPKSQVVFVAFGIQAVGIATLGFVDGTAMAIVFLVLFSTGHGGAAPLMFATRADYFGRRHYATISGMMAPVLLVGTVTGPVVAAVFADNLSDGYSIVFIMYGALLGAASVVLLFLKPPRCKQRAVESGEPVLSGSA